MSDDATKNFLNTEAKTIGGLDYNTIVNASLELIELWQLLIKECKKEQGSIYFRTKDLPVFVQTCIENEQIEIWVPETKRNTGKQLVYTQITYCLPLSKIDRLLDHLSNILDHNGSTTFCKFLFRDHPHYMKSDRNPTKTETSVNDAMKEQEAKATILRFIQKTKATIFFHEVILEKK